MKSPFLANKHANYALKDRVTPKNARYFKSINQLILLLNIILAKFFASKQP
ncbi:hypothetical protein NUITMVP1_19540 [Proteus mirabilis]|nr:hypothetical protein HMPREF0693_1061 [Proteus mirabilis ATCC 29906]KXC00170.1 hypothetical protein HMPREF3203_02333 [Proteus mirabilis]BDR98045.1 hypothetical protein NUITMVP1_19540 [Proteus mirabilis]